MLNYSWRFNIIKKVETKVSWIVSLWERLLSDKLCFNTIKISYAYLLDDKSWHCKIQALSLYENSLIWVLHHIYPYATRPLSYLHSGYVCFIFDSISVFREMAQTEANTCLLHHLWELMQRERASRKTSSPGRPASTRKLQISSAIKHAASRGEVWTSLAYNLLECLLYAYVRNADKPGKTEPSVFALTSTQRAFQVLISCISD